MRNIASGRPQPLRKARRHQQRQAKPFATRTKSLPSLSTFAPMEAQLVAKLPTGQEWQYEPKWDGFRCLAFKDGATIDLRSKSGQPFNRYFPEIVDALVAVDPPRFVLDGELVIPAGDVLSFDELLLRIHPAQSRVEKLAREHPALFIVFDLLIDEEGASLVDEPLTVRRQALERFVVRQASAHSALRLSPVTTQLRDVERWFKSFGAGLDGVIAKRRDVAYQTGERGAMQKYKQMRWRPDKAPRQCTLAQTAQESVSTLALLRGARKTAATRAR